MPEQEIANPPSTGIDDDLVADVVEGLTEESSTETDPEATTESTTETTSETTSESTEESTTSETTETTEGPKAETTEETKDSETKEETTDESKPDAEPKAETKPAEETTAESTPNTEAKPGEAEAPIDISEGLSKATDGRITTEEDLSTLIAKHDSTLTELADSQDKQHKYDITAKMEQAIDANITPSAFLALQEIDTTGMDDKQAVAAGIKLKNPGLSEGQINDMINKDYNLGEDVEEADKLVGETKLTIAANDSRENIEQLQNDFAAKAPSVQTEEQEQATRDIELNRRQNWTDHSPEIAKKVESVIVGIDKDDKNKTHEYKLNEQEQQELAIKVEENVIAAGLEYNDKNVETVTEWAKGEFVKNNLNSITRAISSQATATTVTEITEEVSNPTAATDTPAETPAAKSDQEQTSDNISDAIIRSMEGE